MVPLPVNYKETLLQYFEEEIMGEAYFYGLSAHCDEPDKQEKLSLLARVERHAAEAIRPLLDKYQLLPRSDLELAPIGKSWLKRHENFCWDSLMKCISVRYPDYTVQFKALEEMAPEEDLAPLKVLTDHEVVVIEFANMEITNHPASLEPIQRYLKGQ